MNCVLIGYGEIGQGIKEVFGQHHNIDVVDPAKDMMVDKGEYDLMLVAIPYTDKFVDIVNTYANVFGPEGIIIFSTVPIGTTRKIKNAVHCPIEGKHPNLAKSMDKWYWIMGGKNKVCQKFFVYGVDCVDKPEETELAKLQSTSYYGLCIEWTRYINQICQKLGLNYDTIRDYNKRYNALYWDMNMPRFTRPILDPPEGNIGGHCVVPNAKLLYDQYPHDFLFHIFRNKEGE